MTVQPHLIPETPPVASAPATAAAPPTPVQTAAPPPIWMQRLSLFILVLFCVYIGAFVTYLPWSKYLWDKNMFFATHPQLWAILKLGPVRGVISGLGLLDVWIGISEAVHYREHTTLPSVSQH